MLLVLASSSEDRNSAVVLIDIRILALKCSCRRPARQGSLDMQIGHTGRLSKHRSILVRQSCMKGRSHTIAPGLSRLMRTRA